VGPAKAPTSLGLRSDSSIARWKEWLTVDLSPPAKAAVRKKQQGFREDLEAAWRDQDIGAEARRWDLASSSDSRMASRFRTKAGQSQQYAQINFQIDA
jgi:5'-deoxynucleotidase YfbR-like HD superfamily hydrolase